MKSLRLPFLIALCIVACDDGGDTPLSTAPNARLLLSDAAVAGFAISIDDAVERIVPAVEDAAPDLVARLSELRAALTTRDALAWQRAIESTNNTIAAIDEDAAAAIDADLDTIRILLTHARSAVAATGSNTECATFAIENSSCE